MKEQYFHGPMGFKMAQEFIAQKEREGYSTTFIGHPTYRVQIVRWF